MLAPSSEACCPSVSTKWCVFALAAVSTVKAAADKAPTPGAPAPPQDAKKAADTGVEILNLSY